jgi:hypothetical protein
MGSRIRTSFWGILFIVALCQFACRPAMPTAPQNDNTLQKQETTLHFQGIKTILSKPSQVQFIFSLRDRFGYAISRSPKEIAAVTRIFESGTEIDYSETGFFLTDAAGIQLDVVLVLDFTNSMATWSENGRNAIDLMVEGAKLLINGLPALHRVAIIEYHDRNEEPALLSYFTADKQILTAAIDDFIRLGIDYGSSRCWDAVYNGIAVFPEPAQPQDVKVLVYLSDGVDTSSKHKPEDIITLAKQRKVQIYALGTGEVIDEAMLQKISKETEGGYYRAGNLQQLEAQLRTVTEDLRGKYKLNYVSLKSSGRHAVRVQIDWESQANYFEQKIDLGGIYEDDRVGRIAFDEFVVANQFAEVLIRATHVPRNVTAFRFRFGNPLIPQIATVKKEEGGLCEGWQLQGPEAQGYFRIFSPDSTPLRFGDSGILFKAAFGNIAQQRAPIPFHLDNSIYPIGKRFVFPETLFVGLPIFDPQPSHGSSQIDPRNARLSWRVENPRKLPLKYNVRLDTEDASRTIASGLASTNMMMPTYLLPNTTYYWRVVAYSDRNTYQGPVWWFRTK